MKIRLVAVAATLALAASAAILPGAQAAPVTAPAAATAAKPTIVLVHGAFADASGWDKVITRLQGDGYPVLAVANPLTGLEADSDYLEGILAKISGPIVLVGHSYGGAVISDAAAGNPNVKALVYVAAFVPDVNEVLGQFANPADYPGALLSPDKLVHNTSVSGADEVTINTADFRAIFAADLPKKTAASMAVRQRAVAYDVFGQPAQAAAWHDIPSWYQISTQDKAISPVAQAFFAERAESRTTKVKGSHAAFISHDKETTLLIERAAKATR